MKLCEVFLLSFLTLLLCKPVKVSQLKRSEGYSFSNDEIATKELSDLLESCRERTLNVLRMEFTVEHLEGSTSEMVGPLTCWYPAISIYSKMGEIGQLNPFLAYWAADKLLESFALNEKLVKPTILFNRHFKKTMKERYQINSQLFQAKKLTGIPDLVCFWAESLLLVQKMAMDQTRKSVNHYEDMFPFYMGERGIILLFTKFIAKTLPAPTDLQLSPFNIWYGRIKTCEETHLRFMCLMMTKGAVPDDAGLDFISMLLSLPNVQLPHFIEMDIRARVREETFLTYPQLKKNRNYFQYKADSNIPPIMAYLTDSSSVPMRLSYCNNLLSSTIYTLTKYWESNLDVEKRRDVVFLVYGLRFLIEYYFEVIRVVFLRSDNTQDHIPFDLVAIAHGLAMKIFGDCVIPRLSETVKLFCKNTFGGVESIKTGFSKDLLMKFEVVEASLAASLEAMDKELARTLYRFVEYCKAITFITDDLSKYVKVESISCTGSATNDYIATRKYLDMLLEKNMWDLARMDYARASNFAFNVSNAFMLLNVKSKPKEEMPDVFYEFIMRMKSENPTDEYWVTTGTIVQEVIYGIKAEIKPQLAEEKPRKIADPVSKARPVSKISKITKTVTDKSEKAKRRILRKEKKAKIVLAEDEEPLMVENSKTSEIVKSTASSIENQEKAQEHPMICYNTMIKRALDLVSHGTTTNYFIIRHTNLVAMDPLPLLKKTIPSYAIPRPVKLHRHVPRPALTYHVHQEPTHHFIAAKALGYKETSIFDVRDFLMAHLLIGQRVWSKVIKPLLGALEPFESEHHLVHSFKHSIDSFKQDLEVLSACEPDTFAFVMADSGIKDIDWLFKCLGYYQKRMLIAHPKIPISKKLRDFFVSRHLAILEHNNFLDVGPLRRLQNDLQCHDSIATKKMETRSRPSNLIIPEETETALAVIWMRKVHDNDKIVFTRRLYAHKEVSDQVYKTYIDYIFKDHEDFQVLNML